MNCRKRLNGPVHDVRINVWCCTVLNDIDNTKHKFGDIDILNHLIFFSV